MSTPTVYGALVDGGRYQATSYSLAIMDPNGQVLEEIDFQNIRAFGRDGTAISLQIQDGRTRVLSGATLDDAGRLEEHLRRFVRQPIPPSTPSPPPVAQQSVRVSGGSRTSVVGVIVGVAVVILLVLLAILIVDALSNDNGDETPTVVPTEEQPVEDPTEPDNQEEEPTESAFVEIVATNVEAVAISGESVRRSHESFEIALCVLVV